MRHLDDVAGSILRQRDEIAVVEAKSATCVAKSRALLNLLKTRSSQQLAGDPRSPRGAQGRTLKTRPLGEIVAAVAQVRRVGRARRDSVRPLAGAVLSQDAFDVLAALCSSDGAFPTHFGAWEHLVKQAEDQASAAGESVEPVVVTVGEFVLWCHGAAVEPGLDSLCAYLMLEDV